MSSTLAFERVLVVEGGKIVEDGDPRVLGLNVGSRYHAMLAAEQFVRENLWSGSRWRRFRVENGVVAEQRAREYGEHQLIAAELEGSVEPADG